LTQEDEAGRQREGLRAARGPVLTMKRRLTMMPCTRIIQVRPPGHQGLHRRRPQGVNQDSLAIFKEEITTGVHRFQEMADQGELLFPSNNVWLTASPSPSSTTCMHGCRHSVNDGIKRATDVMIAAMTGGNCMQHDHSRAQEADEEHRHCRHHRSPRQRDRHGWPRGVVMWCCFQGRSSPWKTSAIF